MSRSDRAARDVRTGRNYPLNSWYVASTAAEIGDGLVARRVLDTPVVLFRTTDGRVVALEDRGAHRPYPLHDGRLAADTVTCRYDGWAYDATGFCVSVPSQVKVPFGARVRAFPVREEGGLVWVWPGEPVLADLRPTPQLPWLRDGAVTTTSGAEVEIDANYLLVHELLADVTHVAHLSPEVSPLVLSSALPPVEVEVSETSVRFLRRYPAARINDWLADATGLDPTREYAQDESGTFAAPGLFTDYWQVRDGDSVHTLRFTQAVTPTGPASCRLVWRLTRDFAVGDEAVTADLHGRFVPYHARNAEALAVQQAILDTYGPGGEVNVSADVVGLQIRRIVAGALAEEPLVAPSPWFASSGG